MYRRLAVCFAILFLGAGIAAAGTAAFLKVGKSYRMEGYDDPLKVMQIGTEGWVQVEYEDHLIWVNTNVVRYIAEISDSEMQKQTSMHPIKTTMADMRAFATACEAYAVDNNLYPAGNKPQDLVPVLEPMYIKKLPLKDGWGNDYLYMTDSDHQNYWVVSLGADGKQDSGIYNSRGYPLKEEYPPTSDPTADIIFSTGMFLRFPEGTQN